MAIQRPSRRAKTKAKTYQSIVDVSDSEFDNEDIEAPPPPQDFMKAALMSEEEMSSDGSEFGVGRTSKKRKATHAPKSKSQAKRLRKLKFSKKALALSPPPVPDMSDDDAELDEPREEDLRIFNDSRQKVLPPQVKATLLSQTLRIEVTSAPAVIHINLGDILTKERPTISSAPSQSSDLDLDGDTLLANNGRQLETKRRRSKKKNSSDDYFQKMRLNKDYASFLELEPHLRNRIYREMLVSNTSIHFGDYLKNVSGLPTQAPLLRTCRQVFNEASSILYGENAFHFSRMSRERGRYWEREWTEVGYKDIRRFLEQIGPHNIAKMGHVSIEFDDATPRGTRLSETPERRYVNDPVLLHVLRLIGNSGVVLERFVVGFTGRAKLSIEDVHLLRALTLIRCQQLISTCAFGHSRIDTRLFRQIKEFMEVPEDTAIDHHRRKIPAMRHEAGGSRSGCWDRGCAWRREESW